MELWRHDGCLSVGGETGERESSAYILSSKDGMAAVTYHNGMNDA